MSNNKWADKYVFIYTDPEFELNEENVFISQVYKSKKEFERLNPEFKVLAQYDPYNLVKTWWGLDLENFKKQYANA